MSKTTIVTPNGYKTANFKPIKVNIPKGNGKKFLSGLAMMGAGHYMNKAANAMREEKKRMQNEEENKVEENDSDVKEYEYVFYESGVNKITEIVESLLGEIVSNQIVIDDKLMERTKWLIDQLHYMINAVNEARNKDGN